jgi:HK97 gp10 family phage protein
MADEIRVSGFKELESNLKALPLRLARNVVARATYAGAVVVRDAARKNAPVKTGKLKKSIRIKKRRSRRGSTEIVYAVSPQVFYGHMVEKGTPPHVIKAKFKKAMGKDGKFGLIVKHKGAKAKPFLRPAFDDNIPRIIDAMQAKLVQGIEREANRK